MSDTKSQEAYGQAVEQGYVGSYEHWLDDMAITPADEPELVDETDPANMNPGDDIVAALPDNWTLDQQSRLANEMAEASALQDPDPQPVADVGLPQDPPPGAGEAPTPVPDPKPTDGDDEDEPEAEPEPWTPDQKPVTFQIDPKNPPSKPLPEGAAEPTFSEALSLTRESYENLTSVMDRTNELLEKLTQRDEKIVTGLLEKGKELLDTDGNIWLRTLFDSLTTARLDNIGLKAAEREGSDWRNTVVVDGRELRPGVPKQTLGDPQQLSKEELVGYFQRRSGTGTNCDFPFWHSGLWMRFKSPSLQELTGLQYELNQVKVKLGAESKGLAFSNMLQALMTVAMDFALQFVIDANVNFRTPTDLKERLDALDEPTVLLALASVMYPKGYAYSHPCVADPSKCQHITKDVLNFRGMQFNDTNSLTKWQKEFMAKRFRGSTKATDAELAKYRGERLRGNEKIVWFGDMGLALATPTILQHEESGRAWINGIVEMTQGAFNEPPHGTNRNRYIEQLGHATTACQYAHWVCAIIERDDEGTETVVTRDPEVIAEILGTVMSTDEYAEDFFKKVQAFIEDSMISMVAINSFNCPHCSSPVAEKFHERFEHLVPVDMLTTVFTLANRKLN